MIVSVGPGDLFASRAQTLVCPVNTAGVMGAGLAAAFQRRCPELAADYRRRCAAGMLRLGEPYIWASLLLPWVIGFPTKGANPWAPSRLADIDRGLAHLAGHLQAWGSPPWPCRPSAAAWAGWTGGRLGRC